MIPVIDRDACTGCGNCVEVCPPRAIVDEEGKAKLLAEFCEECGFCAPQCPVDAIEIRFPRSTDTGGSA